MPGRSHYVWPLYSNLAAAHRAQIASSTPDEVEYVRRCELLGPRWAHGEVPRRAMRYYGCSMETCYATSLALE